MSAEAVSALYGANRVTQIRACDVKQGDLLTHDDSDDGTVRVLDVVYTAIGVRLVFASGGSFDYPDDQILGRVTL